MIPMGFTHALPSTPRRRVLVALIPALLSMMAGGSPVAATPRVIDYCWFPTAVADRWDDVTPVEGYVGGTRKAPDWPGNGVLDQESFTDLNQNGFYDPGESFVDANGNGRFDSEPYGALITGYVPGPTPGNVISPGGDAGLQLVLTPAESSSDEFPGHYLVPEQNCGSSYFVRPNGLQIQEVDRFLRSLIEGDPGATWDPATQTVVGSTAPCRSPRLVMLPLYDPRNRLDRLHDRVGPTKIMPVFLEAMVGKGSAVVRILPPAPSALCFESASVGSAESPELGSAKLSWGRLKVLYR